MNYIDFRISLHLAKDLENMLLEHLFDRKIRVLITKIY